MKQSTKSFLAGTAITFSLFALSYAASELESLGLAHILYWQGWWLQTFLPCLEVGSGQQRFCEGLPLNLVVFILGIPFGMVFYSLLAYGVLAFLKRRMID